MSNFVHMYQLTQAIEAFKAVEALVKESTAPRDINIWHSCMNARVSLQVRMDQFSPAARFDHVEVRNTSQPEDTPE